MVKHENISEDLARVLDHLTGTTEEKFRQHLENINTGLDLSERCTWYGGSYYCYKEGKWIRLYSIC